MSALDSGSVAPPGWTETQPVAVTARPAAPAATAAPTVVGQTATDAAVRWRIGAAVIDNLLVYAMYLAICLVLHWQVANLGHLLLLLGLGVVYHFALESQDGQTLGKRRYGIQVVSLDDRPASSKAIALRSVLRLIDSLPFWYLSGLISMVRTGPARRQRIGDVAAETKVVAVSGRAASRGTPGWMLPAATLLALAFSSLAVIEVADAGHEPLTSAQQSQFVAGCDRSAGAVVVNCQCVLTQLEADGYNTLDSLQTIVQQAAQERLSGQEGPARAELARVGVACHR